jgi:2-iminoacetate synthase ThiH
MEMEKYLQESNICCTGCPYCGHPTSFPKDLRMWCVSEQVERHYNIEVKKQKIKKEVKVMKKAVNGLGVPVGTMRLS